MQGECIARLTAAGISYDDACAIRRVAMTLQRWHELECGDGNSHGSWAIERDGEEDDSKPFLVHHHYAHGRGKDSVTRTPIPDRENGAKKRLAKIMARYPGFAAYVQGDPRGASLYILRPGDVPANETECPQCGRVSINTTCPACVVPTQPHKADASQYYTRGIAVYK